MSEPHNKQYKGEHELVNLCMQVPASIKAEVRDYIKRRKNEIKQQIKNESK